MNSPKACAKIALFRKTDEQSFMDESRLCKYFSLVPSSNQLLHVNRLLYSKDTELLDRITKLAANSMGNYDSEKVRILHVDFVYFDKHK